MEIKNQVAVITGGGSGMGAETARQLAQLGAKVVLLDIRLDHAQSIAKEIGGLAIACDVSEADSVNQAVKQVVDTFNSIAICINCAGIAPAQRIVSREGPIPLNKILQLI